MIIIIYLNYYILYFFHSIFYFLTYKQKQEYINIYVYLIKYKMPYDFYAHIFMYDILCSTYIYVEKEWGVQ